VLRTLCCALYHYCSHTYVAIASAIAGSVLTEHHSTTAKLLDCLTLQVYEIKNSAAATAADVKFILDISYKVELSAERAFHYLAFAPDFEATGCFYATYNKKSDGHNLQASAARTIYLSM
jgi:hypothetical protein